MYMIAVQGVGGGGGGPFKLLSNVLDTNGEGVGGIFPLPNVPTEKQNLYARAS